MFNLEQAIASWRKQLAASGIDSLALDELEDHLRLEIEDQVQKGLLVDRAFDDAVRQIGSSNAVSGEFIKTAGYRENRERSYKLAWMGICALGYAVPFGLSGRHLLSQLNFEERWLAAAAVTFTILSLFSGLIVYRFLPVIHDRKIRTKVQSAALLPALLWVGAFAFFILPRVEFTFGRLLVTTLWALSPMATFSGVVFGLDEAVRRKRSPGFPGRV
jgi:hypothetical protein